MNLNYLIVDQGNYFLFWSIAMGFLEYKTLSMKHYSKMLHIDHDYLLLIAALNENEFYYVSNPFPSHKCESLNLCKKTCD